MALTVRTRPQALIFGHVVNVRDIKSKENPSERIGRNLTLDTPTGGLYLTAWDRDTAAVPFSAGEAVAVVVSISESANGASFTIERRADANDLDLIVSASGLNK